MGDLLDLSKAAPRQMTIAHQGLAACLVVVQQAVTRFPVDETILGMLRDILPQAHGDGVVAQALVQAGKCVLAVHESGKSTFVDWNKSDEAVAHALRLYYRDRAAATHARIFPETQMQEAAHAAE